MTTKIVKMVEINWLEKRFISTEFAHSHISTVKCFENSLESKQTQNTSYVHPGTA